MRGKRDVVGHMLAARSLGLVNESDEGGFLLAGVRAAATATDIGANTEYERVARSSCSS